LFCRKERETEAKNKEFKLKKTSMELELAVAAAVVAAAVAVDGPVAETAVVVVAFLFAHFLVSIRSSQMSPRFDTRPRTNVDR
jgi:hypothetical protein